MNSILKKIRISLSEHIAYVRDPGTGLYKNGPGTGAGTSTELAIAATVALAVAEHYRADVTEFFVAGHTHEELSPGAMSVSWEGGVDGWAIDWPQTASAHKLAGLEPLQFEPINSYTLAVYREGF